MIKRRDYDRSVPSKVGTVEDLAPNGTIIRNLRNLSVAVEKGHARFAHQLVDELIALRDTEHITKRVRT